MGGSRAPYPPLDTLVAYLLFTILTFGTISIIVTICREVKLVQCSGYLPEFIWGLVCQCYPVGLIVTMTPMNYPQKNAVISC